MKEPQKHWIPTSSSNDEKIKKLDKIHYLLETLKVLDSRLSPEHYKLLSDELIKLLTTNNNDSRTV